MTNLNQYIAQGNLTADPEVHGAENNVVRFTIAVNNGFGEYKTTTFVNCVGFGKQVDVIAKNLTKGKQVLIRGKLIPNEWTNEAGEKRSKLEVQLENVEGFFFTGNKGGSAPASTDDESNVSVAAAAESDETSEQLF